MKKIEWEYFFENEEIDWKKIFLNQKFDKKNKDIIFTLSWFWAETVWENVSRIINYWNQKNINVVTFDKRWANQKSEFSISWQVEDILKIIEKYSNKDSKIIIIWNSLLFPCFAQAYQELWEFKNNVDKILALSPVSDMALALQNSINFRIWSNISINRENIKTLLEKISKMTNVKIDIEKASEEIFNYWSEFLREFHIDAWDKVSYFINPKDKIIVPENFYNLKNVDIKNISDIQWDLSYHSIKASEYLEYIKK